MASKKQILDISKSLAKEWLQLRHDLGTRPWSEVDSDLVKDNLTIARNCIRAARASLEKTDAPSEETTQTLPARAYKRRKH